MGSSSFRRDPSRRRQVDRRQAGRSRRDRERARPGGVTRGRHRAAAARLAVRADALDGAICFAGARRRAGRFRRRSRLRPAGAEDHGGFGEALSCGLVRWGATPFLNPGRSSCCERQRLPCPPFDFSQTTRFNNASSRASPEAMTRSTERQSMKVASKPFNVANGAAAYSGFPASGWRSRRGSRSKLLAHQGGLELA